MNEIFKRAGNSEELLHELRSYIKRRYGFLVSLSKLGEQGLRVHFTAKADISYIYITIIFEYSPESKEWQYFGAYVGNQGPFDAISISPPTSLPGIFLSKLLERFTGDHLELVSPYFTTQSTSASTWYYGGNLDFDKV